MTTISNKDRAEAQAMFEAFGGRGALGALSDDSIHRWLAVRDHVLASYTPDSASGQARVLAWDDIAKHPFFADCYPTDGTLVEAMLAKLDATHAHTCEPVWRPTTRDEIQPGWELRSRRSDGFEATWGIAYHRDSDGDWYTEAGRLLTFADAGWTVETTAAKTEPEPWDDDTLDEWEDALRATIDLDAGWATSTRAVLDLLAERGLIERPKAGA